MNAELKRAIKNKDDIIITGWNRYWIFQRYDLKYLDDPKGSMGKAESINTIARKGLKKMNQKHIESLIILNGLLRIWNLSC